MTSDLEEALKLSKGPKNEHDFAWINAKSEFKKKTGFNYDDYIKGAARKYAKLEPILIRTIDDYEKLDPVDIKDMRRVKESFGHSCFYIMEEIKEIMESEGE